MQLKAGVPLKGNLKSAECEENLREPEKPAHKSACNDWGKSSQTALKSAKLPQLLQLGAVTVSGSKHKHGISSCHAEVLHSNHSKHCV